MALSSGRSPLVGDDLGRSGGRVLLLPVPQAAAGAHDPAGFVLAGWVTGGLILAAWLHHQGHRSMCSQIRTLPGLVGLVVFLAHLARVFGRFDPFDFCSRRIPQRRLP